MKEEINTMRMVLNKFFTRFLLAALMLGFFSGEMWGQEKAKADPNMIPSGMLKARRLGVVVLSECHDPWDIMLKTTTKQPPAPGSNLDYDKFQKWKAEANAARDLAYQSGTQGGSKIAAGAPPIQGSNFVGNQRNGQDPADNDLAVGRDGTVISTINTRIDVYDSTGTNLFSTSLDAFDASFPNNSSFVFDPRVSYDPSEDRWVIVYLSGLDSVVSRVVIGFSQTNDPLQGWNVYALDGNPFNDGTFTDFPAIALSSEELFITGNSFANINTFDHGTLWQIDKFDGYNGNSLDFQAYSNPYASLHPVEGGSTLYGPQFFLIRTASTTPTGNAITLHEVTNSLANGGQVNSPLTFTLPIPYTVPADVQQQNSSIELRVLDFRMQSSYYENDQIHFVFNSTFGGVSGAYYGRFDLNLALLPFSGLDGTGITFTDYQLGYPAIAYAGETDASGRNKSYISFLFAGPTKFPGHAVAYYDDSGVSDILVLKNSNNAMNPAQRRWGDYSDVAERPGKPGEVWASGTYANNFTQQQTYISQIFPPMAVAAEAPSDLPVDMEIYPNPATERVTFNFPVEINGNYRVVIRNMEGRTLKMFSGFSLWEGEATLAFNTVELPSGTYMVSVENYEREIFTKKLSIRH